MRQDIIYYIRSNDYLDYYLKYHSYWYKYLLENPNSLNKMINEAKIEYKMTTMDKIESIGEKIKMISSLFELLK